MKASFFSLTEAKYAAGDTIKHTVFDNVESAQVCLQPTLGKTGKNLSVLDLLVGLRSAPNMLCGLVACALRVATQLHSEHQP